MQNKSPFGRLYSASDLVAYLGCHHRTELDLKKLNGWDQGPTKSDENAKLMQDYGDRHEKSYLDELRAQSLKIIEIDTKNTSLDYQVSATIQAMTAGVDIIFQATLLQPPFIGYADFLIKVPGKSKFGEYHYEIADTKLAKSARGKFAIQLCLYAEMLANIQEVMPRELHIILGRLDPKEAIKKGLNPEVSNQMKIRTEYYIDYFRAIRQNFLKFVESYELNQVKTLTSPEPVSACKLCGWKEHCSSIWESEDHLSGVANIRKDQIKKLRAANINTMSDLSNLNNQIEGIAESVSKKLQLQANLQKNPEKDGALRVEILPPNENKVSGLALLPEPNDGDLYFDMEGFPYEIGGLEYLFGLGWVEQTNREELIFQPFWGHSREEEKVAFEQFMDCVKIHLEKYPKAHIYHYAPYENTAIKRLSSIHNTRTEFRDQLLREGKLVDLYRVVDSGLQLSLSSYSIKHVEKYYGIKHSGNVASAGESIVMYEKFRLASDEDTKKELLQSIEDYNKDDVVSTWKLHQWLENLRPEGMSYFVHEQVEYEQRQINENNERVQAQTQALKDIEVWLNEQELNPKDKSEEVAELLRQVLDFYYREKLPKFWRKFQRKSTDEVNLLDELDCLAMLEYLETTEIKSPRSRSNMHRYKVPDQETKLSTGDDVTCLTDDLGASNFTYDESLGEVTFTRDRKYEVPPTSISLMEAPNIRDVNKRKAIYRFISMLAKQPNDTNALLEILFLNLPKLSNRTIGEEIVKKSTTDELVQAIQNLNNSYLVIQGPPGTGKSTNAAKAISTLLSAGKKVAVTSNTHDAIHNLLKKSVEQLPKNLTVSIAVVHEDKTLPEQILVVSKDEINPSKYQLVGGTSFLLCKEEFVGGWDYLFVDEASQFSLADLIACGGCAKNIVLLGDQMQLPQPIEGIHPGKSGLSSLDFLMGNHATVPRNMGIFLEQTYRMHPRICKPISEGVYESQLTSANECNDQKLVFKDNTDQDLKPEGISYVKVTHKDRSQSSPEEAARIKEIYDSLLNQNWVDKNGNEKRITNEEIIIVAPFNAQIKVLKKLLGPDARIGTVDKFQGQEGAVAILSMTCSDRESIPRGLDFLFSKNRLNVGISRAKCLAVIVASPELELIECDKLGDMALLSFYTKLLNASNSSNSDNI